MFILFVCLSHRGRLICVKVVKIPKHKLVRHFLTGRALYSDKARSFSQSECALYRNFITNYAYKPIVAIPVTRNYVLFYIHLDFHIQFHMVFQMVEFFTSFFTG